MFIIATEEYLNMYCKLEFAAKRDPGQCGAQAAWIGLEQKYKCKAFYFNQENIRKRRELSNCPKTKY